jgi:hypothetical protein
MLKPIAQYVTSWDEKPGNNPKPWDIFTCIGLYDGYGNHGLRAGRPGVLRIISMVAQG